MSFPLQRSLHRTLAEFIGTFLMVFLGCGAVHAAILYDAQSGIWQVAVVWGISIMLAIYAVGGQGGVHLNPAMTLAFAICGRTRLASVFSYWMGQLAGAFAAASLLFILFQPALAAKEEAKGVRRGETGSLVTAMCYGQYFPNPGVLATGPGLFREEEYQRLLSQSSLVAALGAEFFGTMILAFVVFALTDEKNAGRPASNFAPVLIGLTVAALISVLAPITQAGFNPARDFGPRLFAFLAGWGAIAFATPVPFGWLWVYCVAPCLGAVTGGFAYQVFQSVNRPTS